MKVNLTIEVSDETLIAIGLAASGTLTRATRVQARDWALSILEAAETAEADKVKRITDQVLTATGFNVHPVTSDEALPKV